MPRKRSFTRQEIEDLLVLARTNISQIDVKLDSLFPPTLREAKARACRLGCTLSHRDGEYRVSLAGLSPQCAEEIAYYTNDLADALATARVMRKAWDAEFML